MTARTSASTASRAKGRDYDDNPSDGAKALAEVLEGRDLRAGFVDIDDADEPQALELAGADPVGEDITVPVIPKRADEFTCSSCFLIQHMSRLANSKGSQLICTDCE